MRVPDLVNTFTLTRSRLRKLTGVRRLGLFDSDGSVWEQALSGVCSHRLSFSHRMTVLDRMEKRVETPSPRRPNEQMKSLWRGELTGLQDSWSFGSHSWTAQCRKSWSGSVVKRNMSKLNWTVELCPLATFTCRLLNETVWSFAHLYATTNGRSRNEKKKVIFFFSSSSQIWDRLLMQRRSHPFWMRIWCDPFVLFGWLYCVAQHSLTSIRKKFAGSATTTSTYTCAHFFGEKKKLQKKNQTTNFIHMWFNQSLHGYLPSVGVQ